MMNKLNFGCGIDIKEGYDNYDVRPINTQQVKYINLEEELPFEDNYADEILLLSVFEHIKERYKLMKELERIIKPDGKIIIRVPFLKTWALGADITHEVGFVLDAFRNLYNMGIKLKVAEEEIILYSFVKYLPKRIAYFLSLYLFNMVYQIKVTLRKEDG